MCFSIHEKHQIAKIANKDIVCYKTLIPCRFDLSILESPSQEELYFKKSDNFVIKVIKEFTFNKNWANNIEQGLHSYSNKRKNNSWGRGTMLFKAIIPKGTEYYYNPEVGEYVSLKLVVYREIIKTYES